MKTIFLFFAVTALPLIASDSSALAHSGGLNAQGCHAGSQPYHCHRSQSPVRSTPRSGGSYGDKDCSDFSSWSQAQAFFKSAGAGDPHRLDGDNDGIACEALRR